MPGKMAKKKPQNEQISKGMVNRPSLDDCPCRTCPDGCYTPFTCDRYMEWAIPEELQEMGEENE